MVKKQGATDASAAKNNHSEETSLLNRQTTDSSGIMRMRFIDRLLNQLSAEDKQKMQQQFITEVGGHAVEQAGKKTLGNPFEMEGFPGMEACGVAEWAETEAHNPYDFQLFDLSDVRQRLNKAGKGPSRKEERTLLERMLQSQGMVQLRPLPEVFDAIMAEMDGRYPHFAAVTRFLRQRMMFAQAADAPVLNFGANVLLNGPAGVGKSSYLMLLSERLNTCFAPFSCAAASNGFDLIGLSAGWGSGRPGKLHDLLVEQGCPNPIILLDEVEKACQDEKSSLAGTLFGLLEKNNAKAFTDEFVDVKMDASKINWFATSNDASRLDAAIADRFVVLEVQAPDCTQLKTMIPQIYRDLIEDHQLDKVFNPDLPDAIIVKLASANGISIRKVKNRLEDAMACSMAHNSAKPKRNLHASNFTTSEDVPQQRKPIGFIW